MKNPGHTEARPGYIFFLIFVLLAAGIVATGYIDYRNYEKNFRNEIEQQMSAIATSKVDQLVQWRKERIGGAQIFYKNDEFSVIVKRYLQNPNDREAKRRIPTWVGQVQRAYGYDLMMLLDAQFNTKLVFPENREQARFVIDQRNTEILLTGNMAFQDFYRNEQDQRVYLKILVPILEDHSPKRLLAVLALRIDPEVYLYPLLKRWPTPSKTAETLLIRREGNEAVFLNELRFQKDAALKLRIPMDSKDVLAVKAALGGEGIVEGIDYRGERVIGDVRPVPNSPWFLVTRMDSSEVYSPLRERLWLMIILVSVLTACAGAAVGLVWRHQQNFFDREQHKLTEALQYSESIINTVREPLITLDQDLRVVKVSRSFYEIFKVKPEETVGQLIYDLGNKQWDIPRLRELLETILPQKASFDNYEVEHDFATIGRRIMLLNARQVQRVLGKERIILLAIEDITERKKLEIGVLQARDTAEAANKELEAFSYSVSHDLRAPLRHASGYVELLAKHFKSELTEKGVHYLDSIADSAHQIGKLIDDLLQFSRTGRAEMQRSQLEMNRIVQEVVESVSEDNRDRAIEWVIGKLPSVCGDDATLRLVWTNLLSNAVKFTCKREKALIEIGAKAETKEVTYFVRDNGAGFDMKYAPKLFGVFQRLHSTEEFEGTGVGLANVRRIITRHGGHTWAEAELDKGATFYFSLPTN